MGLGFLQIGNVTIAERAGHSKSFLVPLATLCIVMLNAR